MEHRDVLLKQEMLPEIWRLHLAAEQCQSTDPSALIVDDESTTPWRRWSMLSLFRAWTTATQFLPARRRPQLTLYSVCWMQQLVSSQTLTCTTVDCRVDLMTSYTGSTSPSESSKVCCYGSPVSGKQSSDVLQRPLQYGHRRQQPTPSINWLYFPVGELHSAIGHSLLQARWSGTHCRLSFGIFLSVFLFFRCILKTILFARY